MSKILAAILAGLSLAFPWLFAVVMVLALVHTIMQIRNEVAKARLIRDARHRLNFSHPVA